MATARRETKIGKPSPTVCPYARPTDAAATPRRARVVARPAANAAPLRAVEEERRGAAFAPGSESAAESA